MPKSEKDAVAESDFTPNDAVMLLQLPSCSLPISRQF
jgi:hypothetical protein